MTQPEIVIYGTTWCGGSRRARLVFDRCGVTYRWVDIDRDPAAAAFVEKANHGYRSVPTIVWPDGSMMVEPSEAELTKKLGTTLP